MMAWQAYDTMDSMSALPTFPIERSIHRCIRIFQKGRRHPTISRRFFFLKRFACTFVPYPCEQYACAQRDGGGLANLIQHLRGRTGGAHHGRDAAGSATRRTKRKTCPTHRTRVSIFSFSYERASFRSRRRKKKRWDPNVAPPSPFSSEGISST